MGIVSIRASIKSLQQGEQEWQWRFRADQIDFNNLKRLWSCGICYPEEKKKVEMESLKGVLIFRKLKTVLYSNPKQLDLTLPDWDGQVLIDRNGLRILSWILPFKCLKITSPYLLSRPNKPLSHSTPMWFQRLHPHVLHRPFFSFLSFSLQHCHWGKAPEPQSQQCSSLGELATSQNSADCNRHWFGAWRHQSADLGPL